MSTWFTQLNEGWNAEPNAPLPQVAQEGATVWLSFFPNAFQFDVPATQGRVYLRFDRAEKYRATSVNDEGWFRGQCRFSQIAPSWGEFYRVDGDFLEDLDPTPFVFTDSQNAAQKAFLFYLRDETFECVADGWSYETQTPGTLDFRELSP